MIHLYLKNPTTWNEKLCTSLQLYNVRIYACVLIVGHAIKPGGLSREWCAFTYVRKGYTFYGIFKCEFFVEKY